MKRKRYSVEQIVAAVKQQELGTPPLDMCRVSLHTAAQGQRSSLLLAPK